MGGGGVWVFGWVGFFGGVLVGCCGFGIWVGFGGIYGKRKS